MSDTATSGEAPVAPAATVSAPPAPAADTAQAAPAPVPASFGTSRGSGLARGKRASTPATTNNKASTAPGEYVPTAVQIITSQREYKNPFAPEPAPEPVAAAPVVENAQPAAAVVTPQETPAARPATRAEIPTASEPASAPAESAPVATDEPAIKAELKILPPENKTRPAQSWESSSFPGAQTSNTSPASNSRNGERPIFRTERHRQRDAEAAQNTPPAGDIAGAETPAPQQRRDFREPRQPRDPRDQREPRQPRDPRDAREPRAPREPRGFEKQPGTVPPIAPAAEEKKSGGLIAWIKGLFSGEPTAPEKTSEVTSDGERRTDRDNRGGGRRHHRGGRGGQGYRGQGGGFRGENRGGPRADGQPGGEHRAQGGHGGDRSHHRGGRGGQRGGRGQGGFRGERRGGEGRSDSGSGPAAS